MSRRRNNNRMSYLPEKERWDNHHILSYRAQWDAMIATAALRAMPGLIALGPRPIHDETHRAVEYVPPLSIHIAQHTYNYYEDVPDDNLQSMDNFMMAVERATKHRRATPVEIEIAKMAISAVDLQKPYVAQMIEERPRKLR